VKLLADLSTRRKDIEIIGPWKLSTC